MSEPCPGRATRHAGRTRDVSVGELSYLVQIDGLTDEWMWS